MDLSTRYTGCLLGLAVGDALGAPLDYMSPSQVQIKQGAVRDMTGGGWLLGRPGEYTKNTEMALQLARSLLEKKALDPADAAARYVEWFRRGPKGITGALRTSLSLLADGHPAAEAAQRAFELAASGAAGNETLCRAVPIGLFFVHPGPDLILSAAEEARITHRDPDAVGGAAAVALLTALVLDGVERKLLFERAFDLLEESAEKVPNVLPDVPSKSASNLRSTSGAVDTLEVGLWQFLAGGSFEDVVTRTANHGGAASTASAVAGALAGAYFGEAAIPRRWLRALMDRTVIRGLAEELYAARAGTGQAGEA